MKPCISATPKPDCTSALFPLLAQPLVLSLKLVTSQNTMHSQAPCHNTGSHAFEMHSMRTPSLYYCTQTTQAHATHGSPDSVMRSLSES